MTRESHLRPDRPPTAHRYSLRRLGACTYVVSLWVHTQALSLLHPAIILRLSPPASSYLPPTYSLPHLNSRRSPLPPLLCLFSFLLLFAPLHPQRYRTFISVRAHTLPHTTPTTTPARHLVALRLPPSPSPPHVLVTGLHVGAAVGGARSSSGSRLSFGVL